MNSRCTNCKKKERIRINSFLYVYCVKWNSQENICCKNVSVKHSHNNTGHTALQSAFCLCQSLQLMCVMIRLEQEKEEEEE